MSRDSTIQRFLLVAVAGALIIGGGYLVRRQPVPVMAAKPAAALAPAITPAPGPTPKQTILRDAQGIVLATFTQGARTVVMHGPARTFAEPDTTSATITTTDWVKLYPTVFTGTVDQVWLAQAVAQNANQSTPDLIQTAMQYIAKAPTLKDSSGRVIAGDASYGPLQPDGKRQEGADFSDFIGIPYAYGTITDKPETAQRSSLDCSGFQRMIWGYRNGLPLELDPSGNAIPRRAFQILDASPGIVVIPDVNRQITDFSRLQAGDIVFHDASTSDGTQIDHLGMYLGIDSQGNRRFISSRKTADGPTFGDVGGRSILNGNGLYAKTFRAVRRF